MVAKSRWQGRLYESNVDMVDVIRNDKHGSANVCQIVAPQNGRPAQQNDCWPHQQVVRDDANPSNRPSQCPSRIVVPVRFDRRVLQELSNFAKSARCGETGFTEVDLVPFL